MRTHPLGNKTQATLLGGGGVVMDFEPSSLSAAQRLTTCFGDQLHPAVPDAVCCATRKGSETRVHNGVVSNAAEEQKSLPQNM